MKRSGNGSPIYDLDAMDVGQLRAFIEQFQSTPPYWRRNNDYILAQISVSPPVNGKGWRTLLAMARNRLERLTSINRKARTNAEYFEVLYKRLPPELQWRDKIFAPQICALPGKVIRRKPRRIVVKFNALQQEKKGISQK